MITAAAQYKAHQAAIRKLIKQLEINLAKHEAKASTRPSSWAYAGDLGHVETNLQEVVAFLAN